MAPQDAPAIDLDAVWVNVGRAILADPEPLLTASARLSRLLGLALVSRTARDVFGDVLLPEFVERFVRPELRALAGAEPFVRAPDALLSMLHGALLGEDAGDARDAAYDRGRCIDAVAGSFGEHGCELALAKAELALRWRSTLVTRHDAHDTYAVEVGAAADGRQNVTELFSLEDVLDRAHEAWGSSEQREAKLARHEELLRRLDMGSNRCIWALRSMHREDAQLMRLTRRYDDGDESVLEEIRARADARTCALLDRVRALARAMRWNLHLLPCCIRDNEIVAHEARCAHLDGASSDADVLRTSRARALCSDSLLSFVAHQYMNTGEERALEWVRQYIARATELLTTVWAGAPQLPASVAWASGPSRAYLNLSDEEDDAARARAFASAKTATESFVACWRAWEEHAASTGPGHVYHVDERGFLDALAKYHNPPVSPRGVLGTMIGLHVERLAARIRAELPAAAKCSAFEIGDVIDAVCAATDDHGREAVMAEAVRRLADAMA